MQELHYRPGDEEHGDFVKRVDGAGVYAKFAFRSGVKFRREE